jgi:hypothetical protein
LTDQMIPPTWVNNKNRRAPRRQPKAEVFPPDAKVATVHVTHRGRLFQSPQFDERSFTPSSRAIQTLAKWAGVYGVTEDHLQLIEAYDVLPAARVRHTTIYHYALKSDDSAVRHLDAAPHYYRKIEIR